MNLVLKFGAAIGLTNGWGDNLGLMHLPADARQQMLRDIGSLVKR